MNDFNLAVNAITCSAPVEFQNIDRDNKVIATTGDIDVGLKLTIYQLPDGWGEIEIKHNGKKASTIVQYNRNILTEYMTGELDSYIDMTVSFLIH